MEHGVELGSWTDEDACGEDGEEVSQGEGSCKFVGHDDEKGEEGKGNEEEEEARGKDHGEEKKTMEGGEVEEAGHLVGKRELFGRGLQVD